MVRESFTKRFGNVADLDARGVSLGTGAHGAHDGDIVVTAELEQSQLGVDVVNGVNNIVRVACLHKVTKKS